MLIIVVLVHAIYFGLNCVAVSCLDCLYFTRILGKLIGKGKDKDNLLNSTQLKRDTD